MHARRSANGSSARTATRTSSMGASRSSASCAAWRGRRSGPSGRIRSPMSAKQLQLRHARRLLRRHRLRRGQRPDGGHAARRRGRRPGTLPTVAPPQKLERTGGVRVKGVGDLLVRFAKCCHPIPGDPIVGFITRGKGVTVHLQTCPTVINEREVSRLIDVEWEAAPTETYPIAIRVEAYDRTGLLSDITQVVAENKVNIVAAHVGVTPDHTAVVTATIQVHSVSQLARVMGRIETLKDVISRPARPQLTVSERVIRPSPYWAEPLTDVVSSMTIAGQDDAREVPVTFDPGQVASASTMDHVEARRPGSRVRHRSRTLGRTGFGRTTGGHPDRDRRPRREYADRTRRPHCRAASYTRLERQAARRQLCALADAVRRTFRSRGSELARSRHATPKYNIRDRKPAVHDLSVRATGTHAIRSPAASGIRVGASASGRATSGRPRDRGSGASIVYRATDTSTTAARPVRSGRRHRAARRPSPSGSANGRSIPVRRSATSMRRRVR